MSKKYTVTFKVDTEENWASTDDLERELFDILKTTVAPTFNFEIIPLTFTVKKARN